MIPWLVLRLVLVTVLSRPEVTISILGHEGQREVAVTEASASNISLVCGLARQRHRHHSASSEQQLARVSWYMDSLLLQELPSCAPAPGAGGHTNTGHGYRVLHRRRRAVRGGPRAAAAGDCQQTFPGLVLLLGHHQGGPGHGQVQHRHAEGHIPPRSDGDS